MEIKYSVIIPVYNSEKTLDRCLRSLLSSKRSDVEIIAVNDGSQDKSGEVLNRYAKDHQQIIRIDQENSGVSIARNAGIERASGTYILFVDSDDFVSDDYFYSLDQLGDPADYDLLMFASHTVGGPEADEEKLYDQLENLEENNKKMELLLSSRKIMSPWNKRFKKNIILQNNIRFIKKLQTGEDFNFCLDYMLHCRTVCVKYRKIYNVDISDHTSLSRKYRAHLDIQLEKVFKNAAELIRKSGLEEEHKENLLEIADYLFVKNIFTCVAEEFKREKPNYGKARKHIGEIYQKFTDPLCREGAYCNVMHRILRVFIRYRCIFPVYEITRLAKEKQFSKYIKE